MSMGMVWKVGVAFAIILVVGACAPTSPEIELVPERAEPPAAPAAAEKPAEPVPAVTISEGRMGAYETAAAATLRSLAAAQSTFVARCIVDQDGDGAGEYGFLRELTGACVPRTRIMPLPPGEVFSAAMGNVNASGVAVKVGYCHMVYLPTSSGVAATESGHRLPQPDAGDANPQETRWIAYAWPREYGVTGRRVFAVNQNAEVYVASNQQPDGTPFYTGDGTRAQDVLPTPGAALSQDVGRAQNLESWLPEPGQRASDGQEWVPLEQGVGASIEEAAGFSVGRSSRHRPAIGHGTARPLWLLPGG